VIHVAANRDAHGQHRIAEEWLTNTEREELDAMKKRLDGSGQPILAAGDLAGAISAACADRKPDLLLLGRSRPGNEIARTQPSFHAGASGALPNRGCLMHWQRALHLIC